MDSWEGLNMAWSRQRLEEVAQTRLRGRKLIVVANREPYVHQYRDGDIECIRPAGGLTTALDPVMQACGGTWVAHGSGDADRETVDESDRVRVPPEHSKYTLKRVWLTKEQEVGYYYGFANSTLWPLCHQVYCRPSFEPAHWDAYRKVNELFAQAVLEEVHDEPALVFVQDYHFALLPLMLKQQRPDLVVAQFWHIPWPNPDTFRVCPWGKEILDGMLGNDLLSFHIQIHCNNFMETVDRTVECRIDRERFAVQRQGSLTDVRPHPISVDPELAQEYLGPEWERRARQIRKRYRLGDRLLLVGVDRVDYTKGIPERLRAVDKLLETQPEWIRKFHFLQIGAPSRTHLAAYSNLNDEVEQLVETINWKYGSGDWKPVIFLNEHFNANDLFVFYRMALGCVVSSLHDGMNLVAKEFITAREDEKGVLVLSEFAGAARELPEAVLVNPFNVEQMAAAYQTVLTMSCEEQRRRMKKLRAQVDDNNIYRWAGMLLSEIGKLADYVEVPSDKDAGREGNGSTATSPDSPAPSGSPGSPAMIS
ncbi:MAG: trehalose-6-phosphate synthase [Gemmataceae bacterium]